ncbi:37047_t:CDS:2, partial [Gigaspora margarita]
MIKRPRQTERSLYTQGYKEVRRTTYQVVERFFGDKIGSSLERMNVSKNKAWDIAQKRKGTKKREEKRREPEGEESINPEVGTGEKETVPNDKKPKRCWTEVLSIVKEE